MIAHVAISGGWTLDYVGDHIDLPRLTTLSKYWVKHPPIHILMAAYTGYKAPEPAKVITQAEQDQMLAQLIADAPKFKFTPPVMVNHGE